MLDRDEDMKSTGTRHPFLAKYKVQYIFYDDAYWSILIQSVWISMQADLPKILTGVIEMICVVHGLLLYLTRVYLIHLLRRLSVFRLFSPLAVFYFERVFFPCVIPIMTTFNDPIPFQSDEKWHIFPLHSLFFFRSASQQMGKSKLLMSKCTIMLEILWICQNLWVVI